MKNFFYKMPSNIIECFNRGNLLWQFLAITLTYLIVVSDSDWTYFIASEKLSWRLLLLPAVFLGGLSPIIVPLLLFLIGKIKKSFEIINVAFALGQAAMIGFLISSFYKVFTGRIPPPEGFHSLTSINTNSLVDISHGFQFGFLRGGIFWGWPSSHTIIAFAMALTLIMLYPKSKSIKIISLVYALYIGLGISISIHWFSEFVAGAIIGAIIGVVVGKSFRGRYLTKN
jgi:membrane-associated phospholipid phosphatase